MHDEDNGEDLACPYCKQIDNCPHLLATMDKTFGDRSLQLHPGEQHSDTAKHVGAQLDLVNLCSTLTPKRYRLVKGCLRALVRRQRVSGRILEVIVGHCTFCGLACRPLFSIFSSVYKFTHRHYFERALMWDSVRSELRAFLGGLIFARSDWCRQWNPLVFSYDSSLSGWGIHFVLLGSR